MDHSFCRWWSGSLLYHWPGSADEEDGGWGWVDQEQCLFSLGPHPHTGPMSCPLLVGLSVLPNRPSENQTRGVDSISLENVWKVLSLYLNWAHSMAVRPWGQAGWFQPQLHHLVAGWPRKTFKSSGSVPEQKNGNEHSACPVGLSWVLNNSWKDVEKTEYVVGKTVIIFSMMLSKARLFQVWFSWLLGPESGGKFVTDADSMLLNKDFWNESQEYIFLTSSQVVPICTKLQDTLYQKCYRAIILHNSPEVIKNIKQCWVILPRQLRGTYTPVNQRPDENEKTKLCF